MTISVTIEKKKLFEPPYTIDEFEEMNYDYITEMYNIAYHDALEDGLSEEEAEEQAIEAEHQLISDLHHIYEASEEKAIESMFDQYGLDVNVGVTGYEVIISGDKEQMEKLGNFLVETVNGSIGTMYGDIYDYMEQEGIDRLEDAIRELLPWIKEAHEVFHGKSPEDVFYEYIEAYSSWVGI